MKFDFEQVSLESGFKDGKRVNIGMFGGREYQSLGAERLKSLLPMMLRLVEGIVRRWRRKM